CNGSRAADASPEHGPQDQHKRTGHLSARPNPASQPPSLAGLRNHIRSLLSAGFFSDLLGPISIVVDDLDKAYKHFIDYARDYDARFRISILSEPVFLSPLLPHQTGATRHSALFGNTAELTELARKFPQRAKFQMIDPFGVRWEFNNPVDNTSAED